MNWFSISMLIIAILYFLLGIYAVIHAFIEQHNEKLRMKASMEHMKGLFQNKK